MVECYKPPDTALLVLTSQYETIELSWQEALYSSLVAALSFNPYRF